jgi:triphosphoribosyl-dephospho-CoA synthase
MPSQELNVDDLPDSFASWLAAIPTAPGSLGWRAAAASLLESAAFKPGNVHPAAGFDDLQHDDFMAAALAIARPFNTLQQPDSHRGEPQPLGRVILAAVTAAATATRSNANLGIVLAMAPLAAAALPLEEHLPQVLASLDSSDAETIWRAIAIAQPGGLGRVAEHDLAGPPPENILEAMRLARERDAIARLWSDDYAPLFSRDAREPGMVMLLEDALSAGLPAAAAIQRAFLDHLALHTDSLIRRRHGEAVAAEVSREAAAIRQRPPQEQPAAIGRFDARLRAGSLHKGRLRPINPGTTADLVAAALFVLLRGGWSLDGSAVARNLNATPSEVI